MEEKKNDRPTRSKIKIINSNDHQKNIPENSIGNELYNFENYNFPYSVYFLLLSKTNEILYQYLLKM